MESASPPALEVAQVTAGYGRNAALWDAELRVGRGELVCVIGPNGAGKSTLLKAIIGHNRIFSGKVLVGGVAITGTPAHRRITHGLGYVPQGRQVFPGLTVHENLRMGCYTISNRTETDARIDSVYGQFPILATRRNVRAGLLSGGEQQMLAIGRALLTRPTIVLLDEPTLGLAPATADKVLEHVVELKKDGVTLLMVEQNAISALSISDRGYVVDQGKTTGGTPTAALLNSGEIQDMYLGRRVTGDSSIGANAHG